MIGLASLKHQRRKANYERRLESLQVAKEDHARRLLLLGIGPMATAKMAELPQEDVDWLGVQMALWPAAKAMP